MESTKESILNAAERLFAEQGYEATSLRSITSAAGVNLAAVNYHFQSKDQLMQALFTRGMQRLNRKRKELLIALEAEYGKKPIPPKKLVRILIEPMFNVSGDRSKKSITFSMLLGRMYSSPHGTLDRILVADIGKFADRFESALRRTLPEVPLEDLYWRTFFSIGSTAHTLASSHLLQKISHGLCDPENRQAVLERLTDFIVAGLKMPAGPEINKKRSGQIGKTRRGK